MDPNPAFCPFNKTHIRKWTEVGEKKGRKDRAKLDELRVEAQGRSPKLGINRHGIWRGAPG